MTYLRVGLAAIVLGVTVFNGIPSTSASSGKKIMCYFGSWSVYRYSTGKFDVEDIDPFICTHLMFGFAGLDRQTYTIRVLDPYNEVYDNWGKGAYDRFTGLKKINPNLKTILAIGGWNEGSTAYSEMSADPQKRAIFIQSAVDLVLKHNFDGLDMDWEYPGGRSDSPGLPNDKANFITLLREMRAEFDKHGLLITAAVSAGYKTIDKAYDIPAMSELLDIISLMTYDYHGWWEDHHFTGHNSPLYGRPEEEDVDHPGHGLNTDFSVKYWLDGGARKDQILLGMGAYGRGFTLADPNDNGMYAPATAGINAGAYTGSQGFWGYNEYCEKMRAEPGQWAKKRDGHYKVPYTYKGNQWLGFDDEESIALKSQYILDNDLGGGMVWSIDTDDFQGFCSGRKFPLVKTIGDILNGGVFTPPPNWTTPDPAQTTTTSVWEVSTPPPSGICDGSHNLIADPEDCSIYYNCIPTPDGWDIMTHECQGELVFDEVTQSCTWPENVPSCSGASTTSRPPVTTTTTVVPSTAPPTTAPPTTVPPTTAAPTTAAPTTAPPTTAAPTTASPSTTETYDIDSICNQFGLHYIGDPQDCGHYYQCNPDGQGGWVVVEFYCDPGLVYDPVENVCNWPQFVPGCENYGGKV